ncbi:hypothetical protein [Novosphingobium sp.]|uniref:hypothetical protein n=1 Tax=Novosphingobium sp. TaxID=1874826 RepID=UPI0022C4D4E4|nr:hypothetical protein [Novosphingobium sp.]MCZ8019351.1 hypothetical protein [Novosphingobium sp.]MCZ8035166.1 hypothetical protein [Novosphingobium sp.]MCZ8050480.1 hypothetical protein [Novosphingobium sp.]MCZ8058826.1 hypothetical protein [Novosphingobium sp.]MCZ8232271.1 hypothetical protein [Novosphingobium sp.]
MQPDSQPEELKQAARAALEAANQARQQLAGQAHWSWPRHALVGLQLGAVVASPAFGPYVMIAVLGLVLISTPLVIWFDRRRDGFFVNGYKSGPTRRVAYLMAASGIGLLIGGLALRDRFDWPSAPLVCGVIALLVGTFGSRWWEQVYRRDLDRPA